MARVKAKEVTLSRRMSVPNHRDEEKVVARNLQVAKVGLAAHEVDKEPSGVGVGWL